MKISARTKHARWLLYFFCTVCVFSSCGPRYKWKSTPQNAIAQNKYYRAILIPNFTEWGCDGFELIITNLSKIDLKVDWNNTLFITNNQTSGVFSFVGTMFIQRDNPKPPDIVFPGWTIDKLIWPNVLVYYSNEPYNKGWKQDVMPQGYNGVYLSVLANGIEINERLLVNLTATKER